MHFNMFVLGGLDRASRQTTDDAVNIQEDGCRVGDFALVITSFRIGLGGILIILLHIYNLSLKQQT